MPEPLWKQTERRIAKALDGEVTERIGRKGVDVETDWICAEVKARRTLPIWIKEAVIYARAHAGDSKLGIAVLHELNAKDDLVVMSIHDFRTWFGEFTRKEAE